LTTGAWLAYLVTWFFEDFFRPGHEGAVARSEEVLYLVIVTLLTVSALAYLLARLGFFYRTRTHHRAARAELDKFFDAATSWRRRGRFPARSRRCWPGRPAGSHARCGRSRGR
jgi:hypothetical protein